LSKEFTVIIIFGSKEKPFLLPFYTSNKISVGEVCRKYKTWAHFFHDKRKKQFISLSWKIGDYIVKHIIHLNELAKHHEQMGLKEAKPVEGFEPDRKFTTHMQLVGYASHFIKIEQFQEGGGDNLDL
jgi:transcription elongation factor GreA-like protein